MIDHKATLTKHLKRLIHDVGINNVFLGDKKPEVPLPREILPFPRIIIPISGEKEIFYTANKQVIHGNLAPGEALFLPPLCCTRACWTTTHEMISIVLHKSMLRIIYINNLRSSGSNNERPVPDAFYHVKHYQEATKFMFNALSSLTINDKECTLRLVECLLRFSLEDLEQSTGSEEDSRVPCAAWPWIIEYIHGNINEDITREHVAKKFNLTPQYISKLFHKNTGLTFKAYLTAERMKHAAELLSQTNLTIDEISWECGYPYTSYFIRIFRKHYEVSPGTYRRETAKLSARLNGKIPTQ
jgi:AraC-like DNA-binding protein